MQLIHVHTSISIHEQPREGHPEPDHLGGRPPVQPHVRDAGHALGVEGERGQTGTRPLHDGKRC